MDSSNAQWDSAYALTVSFPADGTVVGPYSNSVNQLFSQYSTAQWHDAIVRGLQTWASLTSANIGVIPDDGSPLGSRPLNKNDLRFGDVRIVAVPMSADELSISIPKDERVAGSWSGDMLFNSNATFNSLDDIYRVALHEAGHIFGLEHNPDPNSPMHSHGINGSIIPTAADIDALLSLYGPRGVDRNELAKNNNTIANATRIRFEDDSLFNGSTPAVEYGDIQSIQDVDVFELRPLSLYTGPVTVQIVTSGISQVQLKAELLDSKEHVLQTVVSPGPGQNFNIDLSALDTHEKLYVRVSAVSGQPNTIGAYAILQRFVNRLTTSEENITRTILQGHRMIAASPAQTNHIDLRRLFADPQALLNDDAGADDDATKANTLKPVLDTPQSLRYQNVGSISVATDADFYAVKSAAINNGQKLRIELESLDAFALVGRLTVLDRNGATLPYTTIANGHGLTIIDVVNIEPEKNYTIKVTPDITTTGLDQGNYRVTATFGTNFAVPSIIASGTLDHQNVQREFTLYIAQTQLMQLGLRSSTNSAKLNPVWAAIYDNQKRPVFFVAELAGETRSTSSILLQPGEYHIAIAVDPSALADTTTLQFEFFGDEVSHPIGPPVRDPAQTPIYSCPNTLVEFCYPDGTRTTDPTVVIPTVEPTLPPPVPITKTPVDIWFWTNNLPATNPRNALDTDGDGVVSPLDVLIIINRINSGAPDAITVPRTDSFFYDANGDGFASPLDALIVVNYINSQGQNGGGEGEGSSSAATQRVAASLRPDWMFGEDHDHQSTSEKLRRDRTRPRNQK